MTSTERALRVIRDGKQSPVVMDSIVFAGVFQLGRDVVARTGSDTVCLFTQGRLVKAFDAASIVEVAFSRRMAGRVA